MLETVVGLLRRTGLEAGVLRRVIGTLFQFVRGAAQTVAESRQAPTATGVSDEEWWFARSALLREAAPDFADRFPVEPGTGTERDGDGRRGSNGLPGPRRDCYRRGGVKDA